MAWTKYAVFQASDLVGIREASALQEAHIRFVRQSQRAEMRLGMPTLKRRPAQVSGP